MKNNGLRTIIVAMLLVLLVPYMSTAETNTPYFNEPFSVRGGIQFGMSIEEVKVLESRNQATSPRVGETGWFGGVDNVTRLLYRVPSIAGITIPRSTVGTVPESLHYCFDEDGHLFEVTYSFGRSDKSTAQSIIEKINALLTTKYGKPLHAADGDIFPLFSASLRDESMFGFSFTVYQWLVEYEDCFVVIDNFYHKDSDGKYNISLAQRMLEKDQVEQTLKLIMMQNDIYAQQEQNDI